MRNKKYLLLITFLLAFAGIIFAQDIPDRPVPPRLVNDFAGMLSREEVNALEQKLVAFNDSTSTQIAIVTVPSLNGYDKADYAQRLGEKWGVGQKGKDNGIVILVKPKTNEETGQVYIASGYGAEGPVPDLVLSDIVNNEILPAFRSNDYYGGLDKATSIIMSLLRGEYTATEYSQNRKSQGGKFPGAAFIIIIIFLVILFSKRGGGNRGRRITSGNDLPLWLLMSMLGSGGRSHRGSWGGFSGGGGGGGFGGFGGGSFGGGGAGGSW
ncbi:MAG TPA: TPM domain-containing protein [Bacteroidales bacterium]|nr:TPM domain-containing protein [Bacteroidales bacterium]